MFLYLFLLLTIVPFAELMILLQIHDVIGWWWTLLLVIGTGVLGAALARWQGLKTLLRIREEMAAGKVPGDALVDGLLIVVAGTLLLTPGVMTDLLGFTLLVPPLRSLVKLWLRGWFKRHVQVTTTGRYSQFTAGPDGFSTNGGDHVVDAEVIETHVVDEDR